MCIRDSLKDLSLEIPGAPRIFLEMQQPSVEIQMDVASEQLVEGVYESTVTVTVNTKVGDKTAFLIEAKQGGIFEMRDIPCLLYTSPSPRDRTRSRMPSSA